MATDRVLSDLGNSTDNKTNVTVICEGMEFKDNPSVDVRLSCSVHFREIQLKAEEGRFVRGLSLFNAAIYGLIWLVGGCVGCCLDDTLIEEKAEMKPGRQGKYADL